MIVETLNIPMKIKAVKLGWNLSNLLRATTQIQALSYLIYPHGIPIFK